MFFGRPHSFTTFLKNVRAASSTVQSLGQAINVSYLKNGSINTMIDPNFSESGNALMKFKETDSHGLSGMGNGSNNPAGCWFSVLSCWYTKQVFT